MKLNLLLKMTLICTLTVILLGAYTRLSDAGLGCPDWPGCYGHIKVPSQAHELAHVERHFPGQEIEPKKAWLEMIHRYVAGSLGILVLLILIQSWRGSATPKTLPGLIAALIVFQALLGMWTVTMKLMPVVVMSHLLGGFTLFSLLLLLYLRLRPLQIPDGDPKARTLAPLAMVALAIVVLQIMLGGWTSSNYAALACTELPICEGDWSNNLRLADAFSPFQGQHPSFEFGVLDYHTRMTIHIAHRIGALLTAILVLTLAFMLWRRADSSILKRSALVLTLVLGLQLSLGLANVLLHLPLPVAVAHNGGAALLLLTLVFINYALWRKA
ncbi:cytochrome B [Shewanella algae]|uniref:Cytochrome b561 n=1 Tax=Shewanella algae TaxID=38313 RepID=A0AAD1K5A9_9GAMM|nr:COX15/CtaA family protein [Shewanella algae]EKT4489249.1 COX15/CtaA family protein [Shewanella algae]MBO2550435.1 COX15/CtaA family protein [Shewanella algae]MBO2593213.1 COX15/CtaA family protein [Shewanella algae]MBO2664651.1 COX15/CtaA family protein [Shewanella algae]MCE9779438.1 COX15/CtaA family protein [Shewanella algae]